MSTAESELQMLVEGSLAAQNIGMLVKEMRKPMLKKKQKRIESLKALQEREEFATEETEAEDDEEVEEYLLCVDNRAATQILVQESGSWRTRHLRVRSSGLKQRVEAKRVRIVHVPGRSMLADLSEVNIAKNSLGNRRSGRRS